MYKRNFGLFFFILLSSAVFYGQTVRKTASGFDPNYQLIFRNPVEDKNFYLLSLFQNEAKIRACLLKNKALSAIAREKLDALEKAAECTDVNCYDRSFRFSDPEIETVARE